MENHLEKRNQLLVGQKAILSLKEAAEYMGVSESTLYKMTSARTITFYKPNNGKIYFKRVDLNNWMLQNEVKSVTQREEDITAKIRKDGK
ncbi:helix-turn-helix domain-containing protein [Epilithonimonas hominis]|uniref:helix-turn-helix domain-containing protein n=1 Tax=Epilithonimonas hominis TaxID=420404 RepID=UPI0028A184F4|nr:helix-turn-helix domain-containing protein [Epilithonimonas hominis]